MVENEKNFGTFPGEKGERERSMVSVAKGVERKHDQKVLSQRVRLQMYVI